MSGSESLGLCALIVMSTLWNPEVQRLDIRFLDALIAESVGEALVSIAYIGGILLEFMEDVVSMVSIPVREISAIC